MPTLIYYLGLSFLVAHELDAVEHNEWHLLFLLRDLEEASAYAAFIALHVPLLFFILWISHHKSARLRESFRLALSTFLIVHALLHYRLSDHAAYEFEGTLSNSLIIAAALCGLLHITLTARAYFTTPRDSAAAAD